MLHQDCCPYDHDPLIPDVSAPNMIFLKHTTILTTNEVLPWLLINTQEKSFNKMQTNTKIYSYLSLHHPCSSV